jgi:autotransporter translocation and assembly factor TamB
VVIVESDGEAVEESLVAGRLQCPACDGELRPWSWARPRTLRHRGEETRITVRRGRCRGCQKTHVLLPDACLLRRRDSVHSIGAALVAKVAGTATAAIARDLGVPLDTVRHWLRRLRARAEELRAALWARAHGLDPELAAVAPAGSALADVVEVLGIVMRAAARRFGPRPGWAWASVLSGGLLLANTSCTYRAP